MQKIYSMLVDIASPPLKSPYAFCSRAWCGNCENDLIFAGERLLRTNSLIALSVLPGELWSTTNDYSKTNRYISFTCLLFSTPRWPVLCQSMTGKSDAPSKQDTCQEQLRNFDCWTNLTPGQWWQEWGMWCCLPLFAGVSLALAGQGTLTSC